MPTPCAAPSSDEIFGAPRSRVEKVRSGMAYFNEAARGGHFFAAGEEPALFVSEVRGAFKPVRWRERGVHPTLPPPHSTLSQTAPHAAGRMSVNVLPRPS